MNDMTLQQRLEAARKEIAINNAFDTMARLLAHGIEKFMPIPKWPFGGVHPSGAAIVGEHGKEIITPKQ